MVTAVPSEEPFDAYRQGASIKNAMQKSALLSLKCEIKDYRDAILGKIRKCGKGYEFINQKDDLDYHFDTIPTRKNLHASSQNQQLSKIGYFVYFQIFHSEMMLSNNNKAFIKQTMFESYKTPQISKPKVTQSLDLSQKYYYANSMQRILGLSACSKY